MPRSRTLWIVPAIGALLVATGVVVAVVGQRPTSFGWFAYAPLSDSVFLPAGAVLVTPEVLVGSALTVLGLVVLAFSAGRLLAERRR